MHKRNPGQIAPLNWLRAFEAAGRLGSFKSAAEALSVSPSTISHQIRDLEVYLGVPLFVRLPKQLQLTEEGCQFLLPLQSGFELLRSASTNLQQDTQHLRIGCFPFLANEVLAPNLGSLKSAIPEEQVSLYTTNELDALVQNVSRERLDVVVRYGPNKLTGKKIFPGYLSLKLFDISLVPIQPTEAPTIGSLEDLIAQPAIKVLGPFDGWSQWSAANGLNARPREFCLETDSYHSAALAVERGEGICLGVLPFMQPWLDQQRVKLVSRFSVPIDRAAYLVYPVHNKDKTSISELHSWMCNLLT